MSSALTVDNINGIEIRSETADEDIFSATLPAGVYIVTVRPK